MATPSQPVGQTVSRYGILRKIGGAPNRLPKIWGMRITHPLLWLFLCTSPLSYAQSPQLPPPSHMKVLGLIGGTSWYSTVEYYEYLNRAVNEAYRNNTNPPLILYKHESAKN